MDMDAAYMKTSTPKRRKLYLRDPSIDVPQRTARRWRRRKKLCRQLQPSQIDLRASDSDSDFSTTSSSTVTDTGSFLGEDIESGSKYVLCLVQWYSYNNYACACGRDLYSACTFVI